MARITGLATGLDVDTIIKQTMQAYRTKIDAQQQKKDVLEIKQKLYRDVITDTQKLYNTHFDVLKSGSLISSKTWQSVKFTSSNESAVTVSGSSSAKTGNYTVSGTKAKAASVTLSDLEETITINGKEFKVEGLSNKEKATNLNKALSNAGVNVSVRYTDFANQSDKGDNLQGFIFESKVLGADNNFVIGGITTDAGSKLSKGVDATGAKISGITVDMLNNNAVDTEIEGVKKVNFKIGDEKIEINIAKESTNENIKDLLNKALSEKNNYTADILEEKNEDGSIKSRNIIFTSTKKGSDQTKPTIAFGDNLILDKDMNFIDGIDATSASVTLSSSDLDKAILINGINIDLSSVKIEKSDENITLLEKKVKYINEILNSPNINIKAISNEISGEIVLNSQLTGTDSKISTNIISENVTLNSSNLEKLISINGVDIDLSLVKLEESDIGITLLEKKAKYINESLNDKKMKIKANVNELGEIVLDGGKTISSSSGGSDANITITDDKGGIYNHKGISNSVEVDGITFNFTGEIPSDKEVSITSKVDASDIVEKVKSYIEDYNALIVKINTLTSEKRDRSYQPLTADQKKEMSETEIELWESKVKQGQLRRDSDLMKISNSLKQGMKTMVSGTGLTLKDIGIESVQDYGGTKDGTFKINEDTLKLAIEENTEGVMKIFMNSAPSNASEIESYSQKGIMNRLKDILYKETVTSQSILLQKVGFEGTTTVANNSISKSMEAYTKKISDMENLFSTKEQTLYSKYAKLETLMNNYNSQMSYLSQTLGLSTS